MKNTCAECGKEYQARSTRSTYCSDLCRGRARRVPCAVCGEPMYLGSTSRPPGDAAHNACTRQHHGVSAYNNRGCRCQTCRQAKAEQVRAWARRNNYWSRPTTRARKQQRLERERNNPATMERRRQLGRERYQRNRTAELARANHRRIQRTSAPSISYTTQQLEQRITMFNKCWICGRPLGDDTHLDHVKPLARGGWDTLANLRPTHAECNMRKGSKWPYIEAA